MKVVLALCALLGACLADSNNHLYVSDGNVPMEDLPSGKWFGPYDLDSPKKEFDVGEFETIFSARWKLKQAGDSIELCRNPTALKVWPTEAGIDVHRQRECTVQPRFTPKHGYKCINDWQTDEERNATRPESCLAECESLGLGKNCDTCPDMTVEFFCPDASSKRSMDDEEEEDEEEEDPEEEMDEVLELAEWVKTDKKRVMEEMKEKKRNQKTSQLAKLLSRMMEELEN